MNPVAYTYDWGMVTDLGAPQHQSRMCGKLGVEHIIVAADIRKKRDYIRKNVEAWLKSPHLGMVTLFMAGDKQFFRHVETMQTADRHRASSSGAINPLEDTHFKTGFLGVPPDVAAGARLHPRRDEAAALPVATAAARCCRTRATSTARSGTRSAAVLPQLRREDRLLPPLRLLALGRAARSTDAPTPVRLGARDRHPDHLAHRRRHRGVLQLHLLHRRRLHRARHLPQQPDPRGPPHAHWMASPRRATTGRDGTRYVTIAADQCRHG